MAGRIGIFVTVGLIGGLAGCSSQKGSVSEQPSQEPPRALSRKEKDEPKRDLMPTTCIALGQTSERSAEVAGRSPADQQKLREQARRAYQQALKLEPKNLEALSDLGNLYVTLKDYPRALETFTKASEINPQKPGAWYDLGMCQSRLKDWPPALTALQKAVELDPENHLFVHSYGYCLARAGQYDASFAAFARIDGQAVAHYNLGRMLLHMNQENLARQHFQQAVDLDKDLVAANDLLTQMDQHVTIGTPSPIVQASYEKVSSVENAMSSEKVGPVENAMSSEKVGSVENAMLSEKAVPVEKPMPSEKAAPVEESDSNKENGFSTEAAKALRRVGGDSK